VFVNFENLDPTVCNYTPKVSILACVNFIPSPFLPTLNPRIKKQKNVKKRKITVVIAIARPSQ
jgi:hypothetical protein